MTDENGGTKEPEVTIMASDECVAGIVEQMLTGEKPDHTITRVSIDNFGDCASGDGLYLCLAWETQSAGFGVLTIYQREDGKIEMDTEAMSAEFVKAVFNKLVDSAELT